MAGREEKRDKRPAEKAKIKRKSRCTLCRKEYFTVDGHVCAKRKRPPGEK